jgi:sigma-B regulation protein RsbU (phosphoserine phosphatase)
VSVSAVDLAALVVGSLFVAIGVAAAATAFSARPHVNRTAVWFALFCVLYGVRLVDDDELVRAITRWPVGPLEHLVASITYTILIPATLFVESVMGSGWHKLIRRTWQLLAVCASVAILTDLITGRPAAAMWMNTPLVIICIVVWFGHLVVFARQGRFPPQLRVVIAASVVLAFTVLYETITDRGLFGRLDAEPLATLAFTGVLGWFVLSRARDQESSYAALSRELELARSIQQSLLPRTMPEVPGLRFTGAYLPMSAVAGDFYEILPMARGRTLALVADVSGHGVPAALIASMVKVAVAAEADRFDTPGEILTGINRALTGKFEQAYVTACCVVFDPRQRLLQYALAGHPPPLLRRADGRIEALRRGGIMLALLTPSVYDTFDVLFETGDRLLMYTDGLTEATRADRDEFFGESELPRILGSMPVPEDLLGAILQSHRSWIGQDAPLSDDISILLVERVDEMPSAADGRM